MNLTEHFVTLTTDKEKKKQYDDEVVDILQKAYKDIGGPQSSSYDKRMNDNIMWKLVTRDGKVTAVLLSKLVGGTRKGVLAGAVKGTDGKATEQGKKDLLSIIREEISQENRKSWIEVSGGMENYYLKKSNGTKIPYELAEQVMKVLGKRITPTGDGYHYIRKTGPEKEEHEKIMVGNPEVLKSFIDAMSYHEVTESINEGLSTGEVFNVLNMLCE